MRKNLFVFVVLILGLAWIGLTRVRTDAASNQTISVPRENFKAPDFSLKSAFGEDVSIQALKGKPILINFWASWCPPCREEMPAIQAVYEEYKYLDLEVLSINAADQDNLEAAAQLIEQSGIEFPVLYDHKGLVSNLYEVRSFPTSFFIDTDGIIRKIVVGGLSEALMRIQIENLLRNSSNEDN